MKFSWLKLLVVMILMCLAAPALAAGSGIDGSGVMDNILERFSRTARTWESKILIYSSWLFWSLAVISMTWTGILTLLQRGELQDLFRELIRFFMSIGLFYWFLQNGPVISMAIIDTLREVAARASGLNRSISPSSIIDVGFDIASKVADNSSIWSPAVSTVGLMMAAIILVVLAYVAIQLLLMLVSAWLLAYAGIFVLGFGGGQWTQDIAINYYRTVLRVGMQLFAMILIVGVGRSFIDQYYTAMSGNMGFKELLVMLVVSLSLLLLIQTVPPLFASIGGGGPGMSTGVSMGGMLGAGAVSAGAAASVLGGGIKSMAGSASALMEAFKTAQGKMTGGNSAAETATRFAKDFGASLASGSATVGREKYEKAKTAAGESIAKTTGGQVAEAIRKQRGPSFGENSLGGEMSLSKEIALFVNQDKLLEKQ